MYCELCEKGSIVNTAVVMSVAEGVVTNSNSVLKQSGCHAHLFFEVLGMGFVKRRFNTKSEVGVATFESLKALFLAEVIRLY